MNKIITIAAREFSAMVGTKAFLFTLIMMPILMFGGIVLMPKLTQISGGKDRRIAIADATGQLYEAIEKGANARNAALEAAGKASEKVEVPGQSRKSRDDDDDKPFQLSDRFIVFRTDTHELTDEVRLQLSEQIRNGKLYAFVEIPSNIIDPAAGTALPTINFVSQDSALSAARQWISGLLQAELRTIRLRKLGVDPLVVARADSPVIVEPSSLYKLERSGSITNSKGTNTLLTLFLPFGVMMLMFMVIFLAAQPMLESGMEEKSQRIAELLLGSVTPTQLMTGKLLGNLAGSLLIFAIYGTGGWMILDTNGWAASLPWAMMPWFLVFQILGVLFFSSIFLTVGASISDLKEAQSLLLPVWLMIMLPMMVWFIAVRDPNSIVPIALSFFPPSASMMMSLRMATGQTIPLWQPIVATILLLFATFGVIVIAGKLYRVSLLRTDPVRSLFQLFKRLMRPA